MCVANIRRKPPPCQVGFLTSAESVPSCRSAARGFDHGSVLGVGPRADSARNAVFRVPTACRRTGVVFAVPSGTAHVSLARGAWAPRPISPKPRRARSSAEEMSTGVSYFEQFLWDLESRGVADIDIPVLILGIAA